jgi:hypothetical protein
MPLARAKYSQEMQDMKIKVPKPRNPLVPALCQRSGGGAHQKSGKALRQAARRALQRGLKRGEGDFAQPSLTLR